MMITTSDVTHMRGQRAPSLCLLMLSPTAATLIERTRRLR